MYSSVVGIVNRHINTQTHTHTRTLYTHVTFTCSRACVRVRACAGVRFGIVRSSARPTDPLRSTFYFRLTGFLPGSIFVCVCLLRGSVLFDPQSAACTHTYTFTCIHTHTHTDTNICMLRQCAFCFEYICMFNVY